MADTPAVIRDGELYPVAYIDQLLGGQAATRAARRRQHQPLKVRRVGRHSFVLGRDFLAYVEASPMVDGSGIPREVER